MYIKYNPNPDKQRVGDCVIRAITKVMRQTWDKIYLDLCIQGYLMYAMPSENEVWGQYLYSKGFKYHPIPNTCPMCYTIKDFAYDYPSGEYIVCTGTHVVAVVDGNYYDSWDSGDEVPVFYWRR